MKIVVASDSYKGCLSSFEVAQWIEEGIHQFNSSFHVEKYAIGDGGEGTVEAIHRITKGSYVEVSTFDAYFKRINVRYCLCDHDKTAVIEVANIIGLTMTAREHRSPLVASSYGVGLVLLDAMKRGVNKIILGLGGSCTNDGGMGLLQALGVVFFDDNHNILNAQAISLERIAAIDFSKLANFSKIECVAACDVSNLLLGEMGATHVFGKQKGLFPNQIKRVEKGMINYRNHIQRTTGIDLNTFPGGGAAGGIGSVFIGILKAKMKPGIDIICDYSDIEESIAQCDLVITGEGQTDRQTQFGKVPMGILRIANKYNKPTVIISGALGIGYQSLYNFGFIGIYSIADRAMTFQQAIENAPSKLSATSYALINTIAHFKKE